jgi:hypothetical protein
VNIYTRTMLKQKYSLEFSKKEEVLNHACQTYQLFRSNKVGAVISQSVRIASLGRKNDVFPNPAFRRNVPNFKLAN